MAAELLPHFKLHRRSRQRLRAGSVHFDLQANDSVYCLFFSYLRATGEKQTFSSGFGLLQHKKYISFAGSRNWIATDEEQSNQFLSTSNQVE